MLRNFRGEGLRDFRGGVGGLRNFRGAINFRGEVENFL